MMTERYCEICLTYYDGNISTIELIDEKTKVQLSGHDSCIDDLFDKMKNVKNYQNKPISRILKEVKFKLDRKGDEK
jgi:hypothetical protein